MVAKLLILLSIALSLTACSSSRVSSPEGDAFIHQLDSLQAIALAVEAEGDTTCMATAWREVATQATSPLHTLSGFQRQKACTHVQTAVSKLNALALRPYTSANLNVRGTDAQYYIDGNLFWPTKQISEQARNALKCR